MNRYTYNFSVAFVSFSFLSQRSHFLRQVFVFSLCRFWEFLHGDKQKVSAAVGYCSVVFAAEPDLLWFFWSCTEQGSASKIFLAKGTISYKRNQTGKNGRLAGFMAGSRRVPPIKMQSLKVGVGVWRGLSGQSSDCSPRGLCFSSWHPHDG